MRSLRKKSAAILLSFILGCAFSVWLLDWQYKLTSRNKENGIVARDNDHQNTASLQTSIDIGKLIAYLAKHDLDMNNFEYDLQPEPAQNEVNNKQLALDPFGSVLLTDAKKEIEEFPKTEPKNKSFVFQSNEKFSNQEKSRFLTETKARLPATTSANIISSEKDNQFSTVGNTKKPRRNIIIISHGRSGSSITGDIFNRHPSVFYLYEPLQIVGRIIDRESSEYGPIMVDVLADILRCRFNDQVTKDIELYYRNYPNASIALGTLSTSLCPFNKDDPKWDPNLCTYLTSERLETECRQNYEITVIKILIKRISEKSIKNVMIACAPEDIDCKIIFLSRDPRAVIASARSTRFFKNNEKDLQDFSNKICQLTEKNVLFAKNLHSSVRSRIMIIRYEDFAMKPLQALENLYKFAALSSMESIREWLYERTHPKDKSFKECQNIHPVFCTVDDASQAVNRWRVKVSIQDIMIMEEYCENAMSLMGYIPIRGSLQLMHNISIPLFTETFIANNWFSNEFD